MRKELKKSCFLYPENIYFKRKLKGSFGRFFLSTFKSFIYKISFCQIISLIISVLIKILKIARENDLHQAEEVTNYCKAGGACGACLEDIQRLLDDMWKFRAAQK